MFSNPGFACYAIHKQSIEDFINMLSKEDDPQDPVVQCHCAVQCCLDWSCLSSDEIKYIEREVSRRWQQNCR